MKGTDSETMCLGVLSNVMRKRLLSKHMRAHHGANTVLQNKKLRRVVIAKQAEVPCQHYEADHGETGVVQ